VAATANTIASSRRGAPRDPDAIAPPAERVEEACRPAPVGEDEQRCEQGDGRAEVGCRVARVGRLERPDRHQQERGAGGDRPVRREPGAHDGGRERPGRGEEGDCFAQRTRDTARTAAS
jgi:hypothetical protein